MRYLLRHSAEVDPAEEDGQYHAVIVQHALGNTVVNSLEGRWGGGGEGGKEQGRKEQGRKGGRRGGYTW